MRNSVDEQPGPFCSQTVHKPPSGSQKRRNQLFILILVTVKVHWGGLTASLFFGFRNLTLFQGPVWENPKKSGRPTFPMSSNTLYNTIAELAHPIAASLELEIWGIEVMTGARSVLKVYLSGKDGDVGIDECAHFSRLFGLTLEVEDVFDGPYVLEVSSPGLERTFFTPQQLRAHAGKNVSIALNAPVGGSPGRKRFWGELVKSEGAEGAGDEKFSVLVMDTPAKDGERPVISFSWADIKKASLKHFLPEDDDPRPGKGKKAAAPKKGKAGSGQQASSGKPGEETDEFGGDF